jgi:hypothetical protein
MKKDREHGRVRLYFYPIIKGISGFVA